MVVSWADLPGEFLAGVDPAYPDETELCVLMDGMAAGTRGRSFLAWSQYQIIAVMYDRLVAAREDISKFVMDGHADCAARIARQEGISRRKAETLMEEALVLRDRLPEVSATLRDGVTTDWQVRLIISRTYLIAADDSVAPALDAEIARTLRKRRGVWDRARLRDMVDRLVFRHDPDAVRERRREALDGRGMWTRTLEDGTAELTGVMSAENVRIAAKAINALAESACKHDGRNRGQRNSDAMFALLTGVAFECQCDRPDCEAEIPEPGSLIAPVSTAVVIHVVTDASTLAGGPGIGFLDDHGVISDEHVRDLASRDDATIKPVTPPRTRPVQAVAQSISIDDETVVYPGAQPADPYRPTTACADFVRVRDGYCTEPGCTRSAFACDLDHVAEYDHRDPSRGGSTSSENLNAKCRAGHLLKTHGDWVDVQYRDEDGRLNTEYITPEGIILHGDAETLEDLFPNLRRIRFEQAAKAPPRPRVIGPEDNPSRTRTRLADKLARRRAERARNRRQREAEHDAERQDSFDDPPPF
ncbi:HNH endonuclease signature motif containing protein [Gordonia sp. 'Campus']|uniref:HNH endonuclease signature motif containing protein n=1 Tax=Gordonia sp. 'Campus' TaxID=2915824 RepID=UPI001EE3AF89|nr:HNH endonuclease signature motif containing protein [Gordonia sp. 'Campus']